MSKQRSTSRYPWRRLPLLWVACWFLLAGLPATEPTGTPVAPSARLVFVIAMAEMKTPAVSGRWTWYNRIGYNRQGMFGPHDPERKDDAGRRDLAMAHYPAIGPFDMSDPCYQEYTCQLLKMCHVDGISQHVARITDTWRIAGLRAFVGMCRKYGLKGCARMGQQVPSDLAAGMRMWIDLFNPIEQLIDGRPLHMFFELHQTPEEFRHAQASFRPGTWPFILYVNKARAKDYALYQDVLDGAYGWVDLDHRKNVPRFPQPPCYFSKIDLTTVKARHNECTAQAKEALTKGYLHLYADGVSPGFDNIGINAWNEQEQGLCLSVDRAESDTYRWRWEQALVNGFPMVVIPTWNDYPEGSEIQPSVEYGNTYLELTRRYAAAYKGIQPNRANLSVPEWIYRIRKSTTDAAILQQIEAACTLIANAEYDGAERIVAPIADTLGVKQVTYWDRM